LQHIPRQEIWLPSVVVAEALRGRCEYALKATPEQAVSAHEHLLATLRVLQRFHILTFDDISAKIFDDLRRRHPRHKRYADMMIAALALAGRHIVVTRNTKDFADLLPKSQLQNWIDD
jgi:predicted nucleic acid-binding protein